MPDNSLGERGWSFEAGTQRASVPYSFLIGPGGEFGLYDGLRWASLHAGIEGWVEAVALAHHAAHWAQQITKVAGQSVDDLDLTDFEEVQEVRGLADTWWRGADSLIAVYTGERACLGPKCDPIALIYSGLDDWGLHGAV